MQVPPYPAGGSPGCPNGQRNRHHRRRFAPVRARGTTRQAVRVIVEVDEALAALLRRDVLNGAQVEIAFDAPTRDWAAKRSGPALSVFLYDIKEDTRRRQHGQINVRGGNGHIAARHRPPRVFDLCYLITAWTQRPEDEHRLLSAVLSSLLGHDALPEELLSKDLRALGVPCGLTVATTLGNDRSAADLWPALGGELRPSLNVVVAAPALAGAPVDVAPLVIAPPLIDLQERSR
ncbi:MAG: DUF4255 domain-containing protein [Pseudonocardiaceae bacterium]|nr:DUF4255 domain-containing protein [Pseudonocardiaceae bacterium]